MKTQAANLKKMLKETQCPQWITTTMRMMLAAPKNLGPFDDTVDLALKELEDFAKNKRFSARILSSNYDTKNPTVACIHFGKPVLKKYVPESNQLAHKNTTKSQRTLAVQRLERAASKSKTLSTTTVFQKINRLNYPTV
ncbi:hypothetical protein G6F42_023777 [Rhizopus arrhizus]|nr:hypothetical protein G6F42_023777 [Rhizopus arrhizus]